MGDVQLEWVAATFFIDIDHVSIAIHIVIVLSPSPNSNIRKS